jgi:hypothetical protein
MTRQWMREITVKITGKSGGLEVKDLAITFSVEKSIGSKQNSGTVTIMNLSKDNRGKIGEEFDEIELICNYRDAPPVTLVKADIRDVEHDQEGADIKTEISFGDGDKAVNKGAVSKTFPSGTKPKEIVAYLQSKMPGTTLGDLKGLDDLPATKRPVSLYGWSHREMDTLGRQHKFYWSIQNGRVQAVKNDGVLPDLDGPVILSRETGLIGVPKVTDKGVSFKALLDPRVLPGRKVDIRSAFLDEASGREKSKSDAGGGIFRVNTARFSGGNREQGYYVEGEGNRVQGGKVVK